MSDCKVFIYSELASAFDMFGLTVESREFGESQIMMMRARQFVGGFAHNGKSNFVMSSHSL